MSQNAYQDAFKTLKDFKISDTKKGKFFSLPALEKTWTLKFPVCQFPFAWFWNLFCVTATAKSY
jgi:hypothetical protein